MYFAHELVAARICYDRDRAKPSVVWLIAKLDTGQSIAN